MYLLLNGDPPTVLDPQKWSPEFMSFISACLQKKPDLRPTALQLLQVGLWCVYMCFRLHINETVLTIMIDLF